jgi:hypothetical protein
MTTITETEIVQACRTLFGKEVNISRDFLHYVQPSGVKSAYRKKAKETHPDLFTAVPLHIQQKQTALFREIIRAYDVLNLFFKQREEGARRHSARASHPHDRKQDTKPARPSAEPPRTRTGDETYYQGNVPHRTLQIGQYLYYRGKISFGALINALIWQRKQRPSIGDIALRWGMLDADRIDKVSRTCDGPRLFGEKAVRLGLLTIFQVNTILLYQRSQQDRLGSYFVLNHILSPEELERMALELREHNAGVVAGSLHAGRKQRAYA